MSDFESAMHAANPVRAPEPFDGATIAVNTQAITSADGPPQKCLGRRKHVKHVAIVTAIVAVCLITVQSFAPWSTGIDSRAWAEEILEDAAIQAADPPAGPWQYWRIESYSQDHAGVPGLFDAAYVQGQSRVTYVSVDGSRPTCVDIGETGYVDTIGIPSVSFQPADLPSFCDEVAPNDKEASWVQPNAELLAALPRDTEELRQVLARHRSSAFGAASDMLRSGMVPADLRIAMFRVLAAEPDVEVVEDAATINGHAGIGISKRGHSEDGSEGFLLFDDQTGEFIGSGYRIGDHIFGTTLTRSVVDEIPTELLRRACISSEPIGTKCAR